MKEVAENYKQFVKYYDSHLKPRISSFVTEANKRIITKKLWTTNNAESMNRVMKVTVNWKPQSTPELIQKLYHMVDFQFINLCSALHSTGESDSSYKIYVVADMVWWTKNQEEQDKLFKNFYKTARRPFSNYNLFIGAMRSKRVVCTKMYVCKYNRKYVQKNKIVNM